MHSHHADLVGCTVDLPFDLQIIGLHPLQKSCQAGHFGPLIGQRLTQQRIDTVFCLCAHAGQQIAAAIVFGEDAFNQIVRA